MKTQSNKKGWAFVLTIAMVFSTVFGGFGFLGIRGAVGEVYAAAPRSTALDLTSMAPTDNIAAEGWAWDGASTLTLSGINLSTSSAKALIVPANTTIELVGDNQIESTQASGGVSHGIYGADGLTIGGTGTLTVTGGATNAVFPAPNYSTGIYVNAGTITINSGTITATGGTSADGNSIGITTYNGAVMINGGMVTATGGNADNASWGLSGTWNGGGSVIVNGGTLITNTSSSTAENCGIRTNNFTVSGIGTSVQSSGESLGFYVVSNLTVSGGANVTGTAKDSTSINNAGFGAQNINISGNNTVVTANGGDIINNNARSQGINLGGNGALTIDGGTLNANGGDVTGANGKSYGINKDGNIVCNGGTINATAGTATTVAAIIATGTISFGSGPATAVTSPVGGGLSGDGKFIATVSGGAVAAPSVIIGPASPAKAITAFSFNGLTPNVTGTVNETAKTVALTVPYGTDVTSLVPTITHTGASISPNTGVAQNFTSPVTYTVTAANGTTQAYTVTVTVSTNGGGSGGGGGSSTPATPVINTNTGSVTGNQLKIAAEAAKDGGTVTIKSDKTSEVTLPNSGLASLSGKNNSLTVVTENGTLTFDSKAVGAIGTQATATDIKVIVDDVVKTTLTEEQQTKVGDKTVYDLSVMSGGKLISSFNGGKVNVSIPYELKIGETAENLTVWYMADDGSLTEINCTYDAKNKAVTFVVDHFSKYIIGYDELAGWVNPFADVKSSAWYYDAAAFVNVNGLMKGQTDTTFGPQGAMTRGMFVTILGRMEGIDTALYASENTFSDVKSNQYYAPYIAWATDKGIVSGMGGDKFAPNASVTREQMAVMMMNYMKLKGQGPTGEWAIQLTYSDLDQVSSWADEAVMFMTMKDLMNGMGNDAKDNPLFAPKSTSTRAQTAQVMMSLGELVK